SWIVGDSTANAAAFSAHVDFGVQTTVPASGYTLDYGLGYTTAAGYGWIDPTTTAPVNMTGNGRPRTATDTGTRDDRLNSLFLMQAGTSCCNATNARWQMAVPNGTYTVTIGAGDIYYDST